MSLHSQKNESYYGYIENLSNDDYHADTNSISRSAIIDFMKCPRRYWANYLNPDRPKKENKKSWEFGSAFHTLILEPRLFHQIYIVKPEPVLLKNVGREAYDDYKARLAAIETSDKILLSENDYKILSQMISAFFQNQKAYELIEKAKYETSFFWRDDESGLFVKARPDILHENMYVDIKTIGDASAHSYQREMAMFGYHIQAAMVSDGVLAVHNRKLLACINICIEKTYPYSIGIYIIDDDAIERGRADYKNVLLEIKSAIEHNTWSDYDIQTVGLPQWYL